MKGLNKDELIVGNYYPVKYVSNNVMSCGLIKYLGTVEVKGYYSSKDNSTLGFKFVNPKGNEIILTNNATFNTMNSTVYMTIYDGYSDGMNYIFI